MGVNTANVTMANVLATNGVVHIIDAVLLPPGFVPPADTTTTTTMPVGNTISGIASGNTNLSNLVKALSNADLVNTLAGTGPFTVFAPTNKAFGKVPNATLTYLLDSKNKTPLTQVLEYHVASGDYPSTRLSNGEKIKTLEGLSVNVATEGNTVKINDATVTEPSIQASNGVVHLIDSVLIPSNS